MPVHSPFVLVVHVEHVENRTVVFLRPPTVGIVCLVVHHKLVVHEVEAVRLCLVRVQDHLAH